MKLETLRHRRTGVDRISVGALTHSAKVARCGPRLRDGLAASACDRRPGPISPVNTRTRSTFSGRSEGEPLESLTPRERDLDFAVRCDAFGEGRSTL